ncbi:MAG: menaquinone reductase, molybdopterin-binding-like subunit [Desulfovibrionales bacterium]|nr:menaquinone reductase, molybdopterin-binding-like subunit [Desulfovibrionales bacterium]
MGLDRRGFIHLIVGGAVGTLFTPIPWKFADDLSIWTQNWPWIPRLKHGEEARTATISKMCAAGCAVNIRTVGGRPVAAEGNPNNVLSQGGLCPLCAAGVQMMYSPSRLPGPMKRENDSFKQITWDEAAALLADKLNATVGKDGKLAMISGDESGTINEVLSGFAAALGATDYYLMPGDGQTSSRVWTGLMGGEGQIGFDLENADLTLFIGADALESWGPTVRNQKAFSASRPGGEKPKASYIYAGPVQTRTAAVSDAWVPVLPEGLASFTLGLCYFLVKNGASVDTRDFDSFKNLVMSHYTPDKVEKLVGLKPDTLQDLSRKLAQAKRPLVVVGSEFGQGGGQALQAAGAALNLLMGRLNQPGGMIAMPEAPKVVDAALDRKDLLAKDLVSYLMNMEKGRAATPDVLMVYEANPVYALPQSEAMAKALAKIPFKVSFSTYMDETAALCDLLLPTPHSLERFDDVYTPHGLGFSAWALAKPVSKPACDNLNSADFTLKLAKAMNIDLGFEDFESVLQAKAEQLGAMGGFFADEAAPWDVRSGAASAEAASDVWDGAQEGKAWCSVATVDQRALRLGAEVLAKAAQPSPDVSYPLSVSPTLQLNVGSQKVATPPQNLTTIRNTELRGKASFVQVCGQTAGKYGLSEGAMVKLTGPRGECAAKVHITERVMPGVVEAPLGFGHSAWDAYTRGKGDNTYKILSVTTEPGTGETVWTGSKVKIAKI